MQPNPCPRCGSKMELREIGGSMRSFPEVYLYCSSKECKWNMTLTYDEMSGKTSEETKAQLIKQWNEGTSSTPAIITKDAGEDLTRKYEWIRKFLDDLYGKVEGIEEFDENTLKSKLGDMVRDILVNGESDRWDEFNEQVIVRDNILTEIYAFVEDLQAKETRNYGMGLA